MPKNTIQLQEGERLGRSPNKPIVSVLERGSNTFLWIGNNATKDKACFATLSGKRALRALAHEILERLGEKR